MNHFSYSFIIVQINIFEEPKISFPSHPCPNFGGGTARKFRETDQKQQSLLLCKLGSNQLWPLLPDTKIFLCFDFPTCKIKLKMRKKWLINVSEEPDMINTTLDNGRILIKTIYYWCQFVPCTLLLGKVKDMLNSD